MEETYDYPKENQVIKPKENQVMSYLSLISPSWTPSATSRMAAQISSRDV